MTNEKYLVVSYFVAFDAGLVAAIIVALLMRRPLRQAVAGLAGRIGHVARRIFPIWLVLLVLFAFMSVSYMDCSHHSYEDVVADRDHLVERTYMQTERMMIWLAVGLLGFSLALAVMMLVCPPRNKNAEQ